MLKRFIAYYKPHRVLFTIDLICAFAVALCDMVYPLIAKNIINDIVPNRNLRLLLVCAVALLVIYLVKWLLNYLISYWGHVVGVRMQGDMRRDLFCHLQKLPFSFYDENQTGSIMSRLINDLFEVSELAHHGPEQLFLAVVELVGAFVMLSMINLPLTLIIFALIPPIVLFAVKLRLKMKEAFRKSREQIAEVNVSIEGAIAGIRVSRAYTAEKHENEKFNAENERFQMLRNGVLKIIGFFHSSMTFFTDLLYLTVLLAGGLFFFYGKINMGEFAAYLLYINLFLEPIRLFVSLFEQLQEGMTGFKRFCDIMDVPAEAEKANAVFLDHVKGQIDFEDVTFSYRGEQDTGHHVIDHLSLHLPAGKTVALVGPSGGGKTTLCHLIPRFYELDGGKITLDGTDITEIRRESLRKNISIVSQEVFLFTGSIRENIAYGDATAQEAAIIQAAKQAHIHDDIMKLEKGYDTNVGERGVKLSGGQKQRISIARAFLKNAPILILDEATSALDNATEMQIQTALDALCSGRTVLVVAHRLSTVRDADEIVVLTENGIAEQGTHEQLSHANGLYHELYSYQLR